MQIEQVALDALLPDSANARKHGERNLEEIKRSLQEFGQHAPLVVQRSTMRVLVGNGRLEAMKACGWQEAAVFYVDDDNVTAVRRALADNRVAELAEWDNDILKGIIADLNLDDVPGWNAEELQDFFAEKNEGNPGLTDPDEIPEPPKEPITKPGDIWQLGNHRLMCGDSTSIDAVEKLMNGQKADMWLTDPPYNVAYEGKTKDALKIQNDSMSSSAFRQFLRDCYTAADAVMKPGAVFYIWHADSEGYNFRGAAYDIGWQVRQCLIWNKNSMVMGRQDYHWKHEPCLYGWKDGAGHLWASDRKQTTVLQFDRPRRNGEHPTMKPVGLFEYQMLNNTKGSDIILDSFGGSGTTLIAAEKNGRIARVMELDPKYCDVIIKRWEDFTGQRAVLVKGEENGSIQDSV